MIGKFIDFSFNYYQMYYYVLVIGIVIMLMWKKNRIKSIVKQAVIYCIVFILAFGAAIIIKENPFLKETVEIVADYEGGAECTLDSLSYGVFRLNYNLKLHQGTNLIEIPIGINRCMKMTSLGECGVTVNISGEKNSYQLKDNGEEVQHDIILYSDTRKHKLLCEMLIKAVLTAVLTFVFSIVVSIVIQMISIKKIEKVKYELVIFGVLIAQLVLIVPSEVSQWVAAWYVLSYKDGMGSRLLVGSLINLFCPDYVSSEFAYKFVVASLVFLCFLVSFLFGQMIRCSKNAKSAGYYTALYLSCPGSIVCLWYNGTGRLEAYSLIWCLLCVILFEKAKNIYIKYIITAITLCLILLTHQGTLFLYGPILMTLILYDIVKEFQVKKAIMSLSILVGGTLLFFYLQIYSGLHYATCDEAFRVISSRTDMLLDYNAVRLEYYASMAENFEYGQKYFFEYYDVCVKVFVALIMSLPLIIFIVGIWKSSFSKSDKKLIRNPQFWVLLSDIAFIPIYVLMCDWGRWTCALIGVLFFQIAYMLYKNEAGMRKTFEGIEAFIEKNCFLCIIVLVYLSSLEKIAPLFNDLTTKVAGYIR